MPVARELLKIQRSTAPLLDLIEFVTDTQKPDDISSLLRCFNATVEQIRASEQDYSILLEKATAVC